MNDGPGRPGLFLTTEAPAKREMTRKTSATGASGKGLNNAGQIRAVFRIGQQLSHAPRRRKIGLRIDLYADTVFHPALAEPEAEAAKKRGDP